MDRKWKRRSFDRTEELISLGSLALFVIILAASAQRLPWTNSFPLWQSAFGILLVLLLRGINLATGNSILPANVNRVVTWVAYTIGGLVLVLVAGLMVWIVGRLIVAGIESHKNQVLLGLILTLLFTAAIMSIGNKIGEDNGERSWGRRIGTTIVAWFAVVLVLLLGYLAVKLAANAGAEISNELHQLLGSYITLSGLFYLLRAGTATAIYVAVLVAPAVIFTVAADQSEHKRLWAALAFVAALLAGIVIFEGVGHLYIEMQRSFFG